MGHRWSNNTSHATAPARVSRRLPLPWLIFAATLVAFLLGGTQTWADCGGPMPMRIPSSVRIGLGPGPDPRAPVDITQPPWSALGRVHNDALGGRCTGTLIGPRTVLTAAHCTVSFRTGCFLQPSSLHFVLGYHRGSHRGHSQVASFVVAPGFELASGPSGADWALLTLETPLAAAGRPLRLVEPSDGLPEGLQAYPVALAGYQQDRKEVLMGDLDCRVAAVIPDSGGRPMLRHTCAATRGVSGAPLLARTPAGHWAVAGVSSGNMRATRTVAPQTYVIIGVVGGVAVPAASINLSDAIQPSASLTASRRGPLPLNRVDAGR
jgi:protease YdgD